jgi:anaerobic selenocysteine-containing dehydrogenase
MWRDSMSEKIVKTACPKDCYGNCSLNVHVSEGKITKIEGGEENKATNGTLCVKGMSYIDHVYSPNRLQYPMVRVGDRGEGKFQRVSWETAIEKVCENLKTVKEKYGPLGVMRFSASGTMGLMSNYFKSFFNQYGGYTTQKGNLCNSAGVEATVLTYGEVKHNAPWDIENAGLIVLWGKNPANTNVHEMRYISNALSKGSKLITIDPIRTSSTNQSHLHISPNPGTDMALALCVMNQLIERGSVDHDFIKNYTHGFDNLKKHVSDYSILDVSKICGISKEEIIRMVELIENHKPMTIICGFGIQRYKNSGQTVRAISMIPALTGDVGIKGSGFRFANDQWGKLSWSFLPETDYVTRSDYPTSLLAKALEEHSNPKVSMLWVERANPMVLHPDVNELKQQLNKLDCIVVVDQFMTDTVKYADIVLPAQSFFEYTDIFTGYWSSYMSCFQKVIEPIGESKNEAEIYRMMGKYMGYDMTCLPEYDEETLDIVLKHSGIDINIETLKQGPYTESQMEIAFEDKKFNTPSGKIEFYSETAAERWGGSPIPSFNEEILEEKNLYTLRFLSTHARERIHSQFSDIERIKPDKAILYINEKDAELRGIEQDDRVEIFNDKGKIHAFAEITQSIKSGVVNVYEGLSESTGASVNTLTSQGVTDIGWGATFYECFVEVKKCK